MKTTVDLPDALVRELKVKAAREDRSLKDVMTELLRRGLATADRRGEPDGSRVRIPLVVCAHPAADEDEMTPDRVAAVLAAQDAETPTARTRTS